MSERITHGYRRLFELRLLHHYWLDEGGTVFDLLPDSAKKERRLLEYDARRFFNLAPTAETDQAFREFRGVYRNTGLGGLAAVPEGTVLAGDMKFEFVLTVRDSAFFNYTALTLRAQKIHELYHAPEDKMYRYKENVPVVSNLTGAVRGTGSNKKLFLSTEIPAGGPGDSVESLVLSGGALVQLTGDQPGAGTQQLNLVAANLPVYLHQGDVPAITPPAGLAGAPAQGLELSRAVPDEVFLLIRLSAVRADDDSFSLVDANGHAKPIPPVFEVRFKNRSTFWRYLDRSTGAIISTETKPLPHTYFGNAGTRPKPSAGLVKAERSGTRITQLVSEVFV